MLQDMFTRIDNAHNSFIENLMEQFDLTAPQAEKVLRVYQKAKAVKLDPIGGRYMLTHGGFWEADVIKRAIDLDENNL